MNQQFRSIYKIVLISLFSLFFVSCLDMGKSPSGLDDSVGANSHQSSGLLVGEVLEKILIEANLT